MGKETHEEIPITFIYNLEISCRWDVSLPIRLSPFQDQQSALAHNERGVISNSLTFLHTLNGRHTHRYGADSEWESGSSSGWCTCISKVIIAKMHCNSFFHFGFSQNIAHSHDQSYVCRPANLVLFSSAHTRKDGPCFTLSAYYGGPTEMITQNTSFAVSHEPCRLAYRRLRLARTRGIPSVFHQRSIGFTALF